MDKVPNLDWLGAVPRSRRLHRISSELRVVGEGVTVAQPFNFAEPDLSTAGRSDGLLCSQCRERVVKLNDGTWVHLATMLQSCVMAPPVKRRWWAFWRK